MTKLKCKSSDNGVAMAATMNRTLKQNKKPELMKSDTHNSEKQKNKDCTFRI